MVALRKAAKEAGFERGAHGGFENYSLGTIVGGPWSAIDDQVTGRKRRQQVDNFVPRSENLPLR